MNIVYINNSNKWEMNKVLHIGKCNEDLFYFPRKKRRLDSGWLLVKDRYKGVHFLANFFLWFLYLTKCQAYWNSWCTLHSRNTAIQRHYF